VSFVVAGASGDVVRHDCVVGGVISAAVHGCEWH